MFSLMLVFQNCIISRSRAVNQWTRWQQIGDHTETVQLEYDPKETTYRNLLSLFWANHNSTTCQKNQYMSAIFYHDEEQKREAEMTKEEHQKKVKSPIVTKLLPAKTFYDAENYHQKYMLRKSPNLLASLDLSDEELKNSHVAARLNGYLSGYSNIAKFNAEVKKLDLSEEQADMVRKLIT